MQENNINRYSIGFVTHDIIEFTDAEMREHGYEGYITDEMRKEFLNILIEEYAYDNAIYGYDDIEVEEMRD